MHRIQMAHFLPFLISVGKTSSRSHCQDSVPVALFTKAHKVPVLAELRSSPLPQPRCNASLGQEIKIAARRREDTRRDAITSIVPLIDDTKVRRLMNCQLYDVPEKLKKALSLIDLRGTHAIPPRVRNRIRQQTASSLASQKESRTISNKMWYREQDTGLLNGGVGSGKVIYCYYNMQCLHLKTKKDFRIGDSGL